MREQDVVVHLAAVVGRNPGDWRNHLSQGVQGTKNVVEAAVEAGVRRFLHVSSCVVYKRLPVAVAVSEDSALEDQIEPWNHYLRQKLQCEEVLLASGTELRPTIIRPPTVLGPGDPNFVPFLAAVNRSPLGAVAKDGVHHFPVVVAEDLASGIAAAAERPEAAGRVYNMASADAITKAELMDALRSAGAPVDANGRLRRLAFAVAENGLELTERILRSVGLSEASTRSRRALVKRLEEHAHRRAQPDQIVVSKRARRELGFQGDGNVRLAIRRAVEWHGAGA
jgi:nucleoside-diphosphate-sugar epimerase